MLKTHSIPNTAPPTTQEIAQAIASLEARSASHADAASQTVTVSEVIQHLGLDMTPEDVLAEVQAQRARTTQTKHPLSVIPKWLSALIALGFLTFSGAVFSSRGLKPHASSPPSVAVVSSPLNNSTPLIFLPETLVQDKVGHAAVLRTLAEISDNHPVRYSLGDTLWTLIKYDGKVYLRCWTPPMSEEAIRQDSETDTGMWAYPDGKGTDLVNDVPTTTPLTIPAEGIRIPDGSIAQPFLEVHQVHLDSHAHERWQP